MFHKKFARMLMVVVVLLLALSVVQCGPKPKEAAPAVLNMNLGAEPPTLDPALATDTTSVFCDKQLFLGLTAFEKDTPNVIPELATEWSVSGDGLVWTFKMRDDVKWVNYNPETKETKEVGTVNAHDVVYGVKRTINPETASDYAYVLYIIKGGEAANTGEGSLDDVAVRAVDDYTVEFTLESPAPYFPAIAGMWVARPVPQAAIEEHGEQWTEPGNIVTNGPYMLESWERRPRWSWSRTPSTMTPTTCRSSVSSGSLCRKLPLKWPCTRTTSWTSKVATWVGDHPWRTWIVSRPTPS